MSAADGQGEEEAKERDALVAFLLENRTLMNYASIIMIIFAVWATIESITNAFGMTWWPPETGIPADELYNNPNDVQNINNGWIIGLGAVCGTVGFMVQYFYRAAPYVDASMTATAALILQQATGGIGGGGASEEEVIAKAEVAATIAADTVVRQSNEDTIEQAKETAEAAAQAVVEEMIAAVQDKVDEVAIGVETAAAEAAKTAETTAEAVSEDAEAKEAVDDGSTQAEEAEEAEESESSPADLSSQKF